MVSRSRDIRFYVDAVGLMLVDWSSGVVLKSIGDDLVRVSDYSSGLLDVVSGEKLGKIAENGVIGSILVECASVEVQNRGG